MRAIFCQILAFGLGLAAIGIASDAKAQFIQNRLDGSVAVRNGDGSVMVIHPNRLRPGAGIAQPGTTTATQFGTIWLGLDGRIHGNQVDPLTGEVHFHSHKKSSGTASPGLRRRVR